MTFTLRIATDGAAFDDDPGPELARILRAQAALIEGGMTESTHVRDINGHTVGSWAITGDTEPEPWPTMGSRAACRKCGDDIEWNGDVWWDRGGNTGGSDGHPHRPYIEGQNA
jgi:hypothetical protein